MRFLPFEVVHNGDPTLLASREQFWIDKKKTFEIGINRQKQQRIILEVKPLDLENKSTIIYQQIQQLFIKRKSNSIKYFQMS